MASSDTVFMTSNSEAIDRPNDNIRQVAGSMIPYHKQSFTDKVMIYQIMQSIFSAGLVVVAVLLFVLNVSHEEHEIEENNVWLILLSIAVMLVIKFAACVNVIGWMGITSMKMRLLKLDFAIQCFCWCMWFLRTIGTGFAGYTAVDSLVLLFRVAMTVLVYLIIQDIREENEA